MTVYSQFFTSYRYRLESFGNPGANWWLPESLVTPSSIIYSVGVGEDISFDAALIEKYDCKVYAFDPTPRSALYVKKQSLNNFIFIPLGVWKKNALVKFYEPINNQHVSHSIVNLQRTSRYFKAACLTVATLMNKLGHSNIDVLKLDIEGAEFEVISQCLKDHVYPKVIAVEFDQPCQLSEMMSCISNLNTHGYRLIKQDYFNFVFIYSL